MPLFSKQLADVQEVENENETDVFIEFHLKHLVTNEGYSICFEVKVHGLDPVVTWYHNGQEIPLHPRFKASVHGYWHRLYIKRVIKNDQGVYTAACQNNTSCAVSQATLYVTIQRPAYYANPISAIYLPMPTSEIRIIKHLKNVRVVAGEPIKLKVEISRGHNVYPAFIWYKNNQSLPLFDEGAQAMSSDHTFVDYVKYNSVEKDSGIYTVLVLYADTVLSSSAEVVVMRSIDPLTNTIPTNDHPFIIQHLPEELDVFESQEVRLICKAEIDSNTSSEWLKNGHIIQHNNNIVFEELEGRGIAMKIMQVNRTDSGVYSAVVHNSNGNSCSTQCVVTVSPLQKEVIPRVEVVQPLKLTITSIGSRLVLYCCFEVPKMNTFFVVWRIGLYKVERSNSKFQVAFNKMGMQMLLIKCVEPDMFGEISCQLCCLGESRKSLQVAITKGMLVHAPPETIDENSFEEFKIWTEQIYSDIQTEKTTVLFMSSQINLPGPEPVPPVNVEPDSDDDDDDNEFGKLDEAAALSPREEPPSMTSPPRSRRVTVENTDSDEIIMEFLYCRLDDECKHFVMVQNCKQNRMVVTVQTNTKPNEKRELINIEWTKDKELPPGTWFRVDSALAPNAFHQAGFTSTPRLTIDLPNTNQIMLFRVKLVRPLEMSPEASFILSPPILNIGLPHKVQCKPIEEFVKDYIKIGEPMGIGAFGSVYLVRDRENGLHAAKFVKTRVEKRRKSTQREVEIMKSLQNRRLVQLHASYYSRDEYIIVMEYLGGGELFERIIEEDNFSEHTAIHYIHQICEGLQYLHNLNIVHLDIKPENIVCISRNSRDIKIVDFGLSRVLQKSMTRAIYGTRDYLAPEVLSFEPIKTGSDMWSLGVVTYVMLSGTIPFTGANWAERSGNITKGCYSFDDPAFDSVTDGAKSFIDSLLRLSPDKRLTATTARQHAWMVNGSLYEVSIGQTRRWKSNLRSYLETNKVRWQRAGNVVIAANRLLVGAHRNGHRLTDESSTIE